MQTAGRYVLAMDPSSLLLMETLAPRLSRFRPADLPGQITTGYSDRDCYRRPPPGWDFHTHPLHLGLTSSTQQGSMAKSTGSVKWFDATKGYAPLGPQPVGAARDLAAT